MIDFFYYITLILEPRLDTSFFFANWDLFEIPNFAPTPFYAVFMMELHLNVSK